MSSTRWQEVIEFWFADACEGPAQAHSRMSWWFGSSAQADAGIRERFSSQVESALSGGLADWLSYPRGRLALVLLLDQFPRNLYRGTARAFAGDSRAARLAVSGIENGADSALHPLHRVFLYMPLEHAEDTGLQARSVRMFESLLEQAGEPWRALMQNFVDHARQHRDVVERFGRFPHRNEVLGRASTDAERAFLADGAPSWGQTRAGAGGDAPA